MKKHILAGISMVALAAALQPAAAADLPVAYRAPHSYVSFTWTGFYFGAHGGGGWGRKDETISPFVFGGALFGPPGTNVDISGGLAGGQIGANYQAGSWVFGVEADASWADLTGNTACASGIVGVAANCRAKVDALGTFAGRLGFALDRVLLYGKGGIAFANDKYELNSIAAYQSNETRWGWMAGAGIEYSFTDNWSAKFEYNYLDFGTRAVRFTDTTGTLVLDTNIRERIHVAKAGINYRFGWAPVGVTY
jgi:outer membrane immunogenic protein